MLIAMAAEITWALAACDAGDHYLYPKHLVSTSDFYIPEMKSDSRTYFGICDIKGDGISRRGRGFEKTTY